MAWLDYDGRLSDEIVADIDLILTRGQPNSVLIVTINGARKTYRVHEAKVRKDTSVGVVESFLGSASISPKYEPSTNAAGVAIDLNEMIFPKFLTDALLTFMQHRTVEGAREVEGQRLRFVPLYRLHHCDGADMVTVGGVLARESECDSWKECLAGHPILADEEGNPAYSRIDLIPLTVKEKIALDECIPSPSEEAEYLTKAREAGVRLSDTDLLKYRRYYRHFPVFIESPI